MAKSQHERYEDQLRGAAEKAFAELSSEHKESAEAAHTQLLNWLVAMDRVTKDPSQLIDDTIANKACNVFEHVINEQMPKNKKGKWANLLKAFSELSDEDQLNLLRFTLGKTLINHSRNTALLTRANDIFLWENVGFHIDGDNMCAFAKIGREKFQPIGFDDGERYIGTEGSKTLWLREFGMALVLPYPPPFHISKEEVEGQPMHPSALTAKEREKMEEVLGWFEEDLAAHKQLNLSDEGAVKELDEKMRETVKLARVRLPRLDDMLDTKLDEHPEFGGNFENVDIIPIVMGCGETLRAMLDDDLVRQQVENTVMSVGTLHDERRKLIQTLIEGLARAIPKEGEEPNSDLLTKRINEAATALHNVRDLLKDFDPTANVSDAAKAVLIWLQKELDKLPVAPPPESQEE